MTVLKKLKAFVPTLEDTVGTLSQPAPTTATVSHLPPPATAASSAPPVAPPPSTATEKRTGPRRRSALPPERLYTRTGGTDGRSLRRTGRTALLSLKVHPDLPEAMKQAAWEDNITLGALMDEMWAAWVQRRERQRGRGPRAEADEADEA